MKHVTPKIVVVTTTLFLLLLLLGCTESNLVPPYTTSQFVNRTTDLNATLFYAGYYDGNCLGLDGNKITVRDCNAATVDWSTIVNFPAACGVGQAVQIVDATLTCIDLNSAIGVMSVSAFDGNLKSAMDGNIGAVIGWMDGNAGAYMTLPTYDGNIKRDMDGNIAAVIGWIDGNFATTTYYPDRNSFSGGTIVSTQIELMKYYDNNAFVYREGSGANPLDINIYFTGVAGFTQLVLREYYLGSSSHNMLVQLWDYDTNSWEQYFDYVGQSGYTIIAVPIYDDTDHINDTNVILNLHHVQNGVTSHYQYIDFAWLINGNNVGASTDLNGYARYNFGYNNFLGDGNFTTTGDLNVRNADVNRLNNLKYSVDANRNFWIGVPSDKNYDGSGSGAGNNLFVGGVGGKRLVTGVANGGQNNICIGANAAGNEICRDLNTGSNNVCIGSCVQLKSGSYNFCSTGSCAGLVTGSSNVGVGVLSLYSNVNSSKNTAVGYKALYGATGEDNVGIGYESLAAVGATGTGRVCIGRGCGYYQTASNIACVGTSACSGAYGVTNTGSVGMGYQALQYAGGVLNTGIGYRSGENLNTGTENTFLGSYAGFSDKNGSQNIFIGDYAGYYSTNYFNDSNMLIIDNGYRGDLNKQRSYALLYGEMGATPASQMLTVNGDLNVTKDLNVLQNGYFDKNAYISGRLGVGTNSPQTTLQVGSGQTASTLSGTSGGLFVTNTGSASTNYIFHTKSAGGEFYVANNGYVGVGTSSPGYGFDVNGTSSNSGGIRITRQDESTGPAYLIFRKSTTTPSTSDFIGYLNFESTDSGGNATTYSNIRSWSSGVTDGAEEATMSFRNYSAGTDTEVMRMKGSDIGIGTTSPSYRVDINGANPTLRLKQPTSGGNAAILMLDGYRASNAVLGQIIFYNNADSVATIQSQRDGANDAGDLEFYTQVAGGANTERMRILSDGNIGIGTTTPAYKLDVIGDVNAACFWMRDKNSFCSKADLISTVIPALDAGKYLTNDGTTLSWDTPAGGSGTDTNWQTSWTEFDTNMKITYDLNTENTQHTHDAMYYTQAQSDANWAKYLPLTGGVMTGDINANGTNISDANSLIVKNGTSYSWIDNNGSCMRLISGATIVYIGC